MFSDTDVGVASGQRRASTINQVLMSAVDTCPFDKGVLGAFESTISVSNLKKKHLNSLTIISQKNMRGLKPTEKLDVLFSVMEVRNVFAACLQETCRSGMEVLQHDKYCLITAVLDPKGVK